MNPTVMAVLARDTNADSRNAAGTMDIENRKNIENVTTTFVFQKKENWNNSPNPTSMSDDSILTRMLVMNQLTVSTEDKAYLVQYMESKRPIVRIDTRSCSSFSVTI